MTSKIEWCEDTWNPIVGCSVVSPGCTNCYAMRMAGRLEAMSIAHEAKHGGDPGPLVLVVGIGMRRAFRFRCELMEGEGM